MEPKNWSVVIVTPNKFEGTIQADLMRDAGAKRVRVLTSNDEGLAWAQESNANIVVLALDVAPEKGLDWVRSLRRLSGFPAQRAFVFVTSRELTAPLIEQCRIVGANAAIGLPISHATLINTINKVLAKPRPFIDCEAYVGPCRRAGIVSAGKGKGRRKFDTEAQPQD